MSDKLVIFLLDNSNNIIEELNIIKQIISKFIIQLRQKIKKFQKIYMIFQLSENYNEIIINNDKIYNSIKDNLLVHDIRDNILGQSLFVLNYNKFSESK